ncbi:hypothetical protein PV08_08194 [Exophiala spinifera]|uniref:Uncharacterized protein n=1 Tax=Exophiala spinifera TaxID=91928 RepID=A0A0D1ZJP8_9EURO|nr:uncharacterized protein PV08_08194 [Exophiala spinifera]KIW13007.1 hypothetical protein PV08_08194 [Exophiala spinifera]
MATNQVPVYSALPSNDEDQTQNHELDHVEPTTAPVVQSHPSEERSEPLLVSTTPGDDSPHESPNGSVHQRNTEDSVTQPLSSRPTVAGAATSPPQRLKADRRHSSFSTLKERIRGSLTPSLHNLLEKDSSGEGTSREYRRKTQRNRLLRLTVGEWLNTVILCVMYFGILYAYSQSTAISVPQRRIFNALTTGVSLLLGVNLAASLRSYAKLLRWRILAACYRPLETFDLVMGCDSLLNVFKLVYKAKNHRYKYLPSRTQIFCVLWLLVHLAVTVLVGIIGLNYNLDTSPYKVLFRKGAVNILDLDSLWGGTDDSTYLSDLYEIHLKGLAGINGDEYSLSDLDDDFSYVTWEYDGYPPNYFGDGAGRTVWYFQDLNGDDLSEVAISTRHIQTQANCTGFNVTEGQYGNLSYVVFNDGDKEVNRSLPAVPGYGSLMTVAHMNSTCGERCTNVEGFQALSDLWSISEAVYFTCTNTVGHPVDPKVKLSSNYSVSDQVARMLAGAIGWDKMTPTRQKDGTLVQYQIYQNITTVGFNGWVDQPDADTMGDIISSFTTGLIATLDASQDPDYRENVDDGRQPIPAQVLQVTWRYAGTILAIIPFIHCCTLVTVILWANKAIIKDDSHLAISKVYHTFLNQLGEQGCLLRGDQIVQVLANPDVAYGWRESNEHDGAMHVDVFQKGRDQPRAEKPFVEGWYDGNSRIPLVNGFGNAMGLSRRYRDFDAADYF